MCHHESSTKRGGFTIIEVLIVVAIIAVLLGLGIGAAFKVVDSQRIATTENLLRTVDKSLHAHWDIIVADAKKETPSAAVLALAGGNESRAQVLWIKLRLAEAFPQSFAEVKNTLLGNGVYGAGPGGPWIEPARRKYMSTYYNTTKLAGPTSNPLTQSSACLLIALSVNRGGAKLDAGNLANSLNDTDNDGVKEIVDSWGQPLNFQRFPIGFGDLATLNKRANAPQGMADPLDPDGLLQLDTPPWYGTASGTTFSGIFTPPHLFPPGTPQPFWVPFVSSNGRDEKLGTNDDLLSYRLRIGDRGD